MLHDKVEDSFKFGVPMAAGISSFVFLANLYDTGAVFFYHGVSFFHHFDVYNASVLFGKVLNILFQSFMLNLFFKHITDPVSW